MIEIRRIDKTLDYSKYDEIYAIVRSWKNTNPHITQMAELSPQPGLFRTYHHLADTNQWNQTAFDEIYVPQFLYDLHHSPKSIAALNQLYLDDKAGKRICLLCFCTNETMCHRSIIAGLLQGVGCDVRLETNADYRHYYTKWCETKHT